MFHSSWYLAWGGCHWWSLRFTRSICPTWETISGHWSCLHPQTSRYLQSNRFHWSFSWDTRTLLWPSSSISTPQSGWWFPMDTVNTSTIPASFDWNTPPFLSKKCLTLLDDISSELFSLWVDGLHNELKMWYEFLYKNYMNIKHIPIPFD